MLALFDIVLILFVAKVATEVIGRVDVSPVVAELLTGISPPSSSTSWQSWAFS
jgi:Kef-type K+ transport system membrane component KefB